MVKESNGVVKKSIQALEILNIQDTIQNIHQNMNILCW